jgi:hypothetical protein
MALVRGAKREDAGANDKPKIVDHDASFGNMSLSVRHMMETMESRN